MLGRAVSGCCPGAVLHAGVSCMSMSMPPVRPQVRACEAMLAVDAPEDHSLQGVSMAGRAPKLPGRAAGTVSTPVHGLTAPSCRNLQACPNVSHLDTASPVTGAGPFVYRGVPCIILMIPHDFYALPDHCKPFSSRTDTVWASSSLELTCPAVGWPLACWLRPLRQLPCWQHHVLPLHLEPPWLHAPSPLPGSLRLDCLMQPPQLGSGHGSGSERQSHTRVPSLSPQEPEPAQACPLPGAAACPAQERCVCAASEWCPEAPAAAASVQLCWGFPLECHRHRRQSPAQDVFRPRRRE